MLQGGSCAESFEDCTAINVREDLKVLLQMALILSYTGSKQVIKVGRIAGQFAKPRSKDTEIYPKILQLSIQQKNIQPIKINNTPIRPQSFTIFVKNGSIFQMI